MTLARRLALLAASLWLASCATRPPSIEAMPWTSGRLSIKVDASAEQPARSLSASFDLRGGDNGGELRLVSPLGALMAVATWSAGQASLVTADGTRIYSDLDELSRQALGESLPLRALPDWLAGKAWPGAASQPLPGGFEQLGWRVDLARYADGWVDARRDTAPITVVRARLLREP